MGKQLGRQFKLYRSNTNIDSTPETPADSAAVSGKTWLEIPTVTDVSLPASVNEIEFPTRENGGETQYFGGQFQEGLEFTIAVDKTDDGFMALRSAFKTRAPIALVSVDEDIANSGAIGYAANFTITEFPEDQALANVATVQVTARPSSAIVREYATP